MSTVKVAPPFCVRTAALALMCVTTGCGSVHSANRAVAGSSAGAAGFANRSELAWIARVGTWLTGLYDVANANVPPGGYCVQTFRHQVGKAPTTRLKPALQAFMSFCKKVDEGQPEGALLSEYDKARGLTLLGEGQQLPDGSGSYLDGHATYAATFIVGHDVEVRCWSGPDWSLLTRETAALDGVPTGKEAGLTTFAGNKATIQLSPSTCASLRRVERGRVTLSELRQWQVKRIPVGFLDSEAVKVLAHEAEHARGVRSEAAAECYAIQEVPATAVELGTDPATAREMDLVLWSVFPQAEPRGYSSPQCKMKGSLDLHLAATWWPAHR